MAAAQREYDGLQTKRAEIQARIARLKETIVSLAYLVNEEGQSESLDTSGMGLTEAVAKVLRLSGMALTPANVRDELVRMGFDTKRYAEIIPTVTKVLKRLHEKGHVDVSVTRDANERKLYTWSPMQPASSGVLGSADDKLLDQVREIFGGPVVVSNLPVCYREETNSKAKATGGCKRREGRERSTRGG